MVIGGKYVCIARNFDIGTWNGREFEYMRTKWHEAFPDTELHWDEGAPHGTAKPYVLISLNNEVINIYKSDAS
jgi:hypothetical protein